MQPTASNLSETNNESSNSVKETQAKPHEHEGVGFENIVSGLAIAIAILTWFFAIRYPLWLDETSSYWQVSAGFSQLWARKAGMFIAYPLLLWLTKTVIGTSVFALRLPSILAMLAATALLYKTAKDLFGAAAASFATVVFCVHPTVIFASIDARPYAFAVLAVVLSIQATLRWIRSSSTKDAVLAGVCAALVVYFHLLFAITLPAFLLYVIIVKRQQPERFRPNWAAALIPFAILSAPALMLIPNLFHSRGAHVFSQKPTIDELALAFAPDFLLALFAVTMLLASATKRIANPAGEKRGAALLAVVIGLGPLLAFFLLSELTPIHMFVGRYYLSSIPGVALCWGMMAGWIDCKWLRAGLCATVALSSMAINYNPTFTASHGYTWKYALDAAERNSAPDHAPILLCSGIVESNQVTAPIDVKSDLLPQLSYYPLSSPVLGLPYSLTPVARKEIDDFIGQAAPRRQRFLAMGFTPSYDSIRYMIEKTDGTYEAHKVGVFDNVAVVEFRPK